MAREAFLINPPKRIKVGRFKSRKVKRLHNTWFERAIGVRTFAKAHSIAAVKGKKKRVRTKRRSNPLGEGLMLIGGNPPMKHRRRKHAKRHKGFLSFLDNPRRSSHRLRHSKRRRHNPVGRRRHRRNPAAVSGSALSLKNPMSFAMPLLVGAGGAAASVSLPLILKMDTGYTKYLVQAGVALGGAFFFKGANKVAWIAGVGAGILAPMIEKAINPTTTTTAGLGAFLPAGSFSIPMIPQAPAKPAQYGAFPNEFSAYPSESITPY